MVSYVKAARTAQLLQTDPDAISADPGLRTFALARGRPIYSRACAECHGDVGRGDRERGVPDLTDEHWLYGTGQVSDILRVATYGVRAHVPGTWNQAVMPAFGTPAPAGEKGLQPLSPGDIGDLIAFLRRQQQKPFDTSAAARGAAIFADRGACFDCHGADGRGDAAIGAPNLTDDRWTYGDGSDAALFRSIAMGRHGVCPAWKHRLSAADLVAVAVYVRSLGAAARRRGPTPP